MTMDLFTPAWWEAVGARAANTALAVAIPLIAYIAANDLAPLDALQMVAVQVILVVASSLYRLPEVTGKVVPLWRAVLVRTARTIGQTLGTALVGVTLLDAVDWRAAWVLIATATLVTLLRTIKDYLPEQEPVEFPAGADGTVSVTSVGGVMPAGYTDADYAAVEPDDPRHRA